MTVQPLGKLIKDEKNNIKYLLPKGPPVDQKCKFCQHPHLIGGAYLLFTSSTNLIKSRLRLNDGAKLWISFKLCCWINFDARKFPEFIAKYEPVSRFLIEPIAIPCWINFDARKFNKFIAKYEPSSRFLMDSIAMRC